MAILFTKGSWVNEIFNFYNYEAKVFFLIWAGNFDIDRNNSKRIMEKWQEIYLQLLITNDVKYWTLKIQSVFFSVTDQPNALWSLASAFALKIIIIYWNKNYWYFFSPAGKLRVWYHAGPILWLRLKNYSKRRGWRDHYNYINP